MSTALTTACRYWGGGAGIQTILKTIVMNSIFAMRAIKAPPLQNTTGVTFTLDLSGFLTGVSGFGKESDTVSPGRIFFVFDRANPVASPREYARKTCNPGLHSGTLKRED